jgi:membrane-bound lytic murein transglycosylase D
MHFLLARAIVCRGDMKNIRIIWIVSAIISVSAERAPSLLENFEFDPSRISQAGQEIFNRLAPASVKERYEFASAEDIRAYFSPIQAALSGESVEALAAIQPQARQVLELLKANPRTQGYADWLEARMDFFEMAAEVAHAIPVPKPPITTPAPPSPPQPQFPPCPTTPQKPLPPHPTPSLPPHPTTPQPKPTLIPHPTEPPVIAATPPPAVEKARNRYVENKQVWLRKLAGRPAPARAAALLPDLQRIFRAEGVPPELVWQAEAESTFNPAARSPVGAAGLYQFMPATAQQFGLSLSPEDERFDALKNARAAAQYLKRLHGRFGDWPLAFAAYNCGEGRVSKTLRENRGRSFDDIHDKLPAETRMYVPKIAALVQLRENTDMEKL